MTTTSRRVPTGERAARKRAAIVRAARRQFLEHGFGAGMDHIAAEAGVSKVTVYNHFAGKEELFTEVVSDALEQALGQTMRAMNERLRTGDDLRDVLCATAREWVEGIAQPDVLALRALITAEARRFPELGRLWRRHGPDRFAEPLATALAARDDLDIPRMELAIVQFYALVLYPHIVHSAYGDRLDPGFTDELITTGVDMFLKYYRKR
ncbi:TetR family transcriptional regulator [[Actinomadura] parvosata subsp. kistnae]|uniref:TetR family transcriptional regulator n=1 Tax=[Actinomadura] parvosata subsp. kistnae TaxID=1909395 RepID=A0A1U9ZRQ1_9ACTN|nr:TetR/AcrR family transcriptional regulator [Nonomuraea sp. ATCC 55076]AQZ60625.1 TetR family transcriptional regulator [Nonomuraea sp. ATCC 55076]